MRKLRHRLEYLIYLAIKGGLRLLPHRWVGTVGRALGYLAFAVSRRYRRLAYDNLRRALPELDDATRRRTVLRCFLHWLQILFEGVSMTRFDRQELRQLFDVAGREHLDEAMAGGRGVMLVTAHYGAFEMNGYFLGTFLERPHILVRPPSNPLMAKELIAVRSGPGTVSIDRKVGARGFARELENGGVCALASDQRVPPRNGLLLDFLGQPAWTTILPAYLAGRNGSPVVPFYTERLAGARYRVTFLPPLRVADRSREEAARSTQEINDLFGEWIRRRPEIWLWLHTRWRRLAVYREEKVLRRLRRDSGIPDDLDASLPPQLGSAVDVGFLERGTSLLVLSDSGEGRGAHRPASRARPRRSAAALRATGGARGVGGDRRGGGIAHRVAVRAPHGGGRQ
jgi:KDO2-lipid IV(A) lauroyltransferase